MSESDAKPRQAKTTLEDLLRLDDITDAISSKRHHLIGLLESTVVTKANTLAVTNDPDTAKMALDIIHTYQSLLVQEEKGAGDRTKIKLKHTETQIQDEANKLTTEILEKIALGTIQPRSDLTPLARPLENLDDALSEIAGEINKPIKPGELRDSPTDLSD